MWINVENRCVICGAIIPEGRQICPNCENGELPKEQEVIYPTIDEYGEVFCGNCGESVGIVGKTTKIVIRMRYCPECGKAVNWKAVKWNE